MVDSTRAVRANKSQAAAAAEASSPRKVRQARKKKNTEFDPEFPFAAPLESALVSALPIQRANTRTTWLPTLPRSSSAERGVTPSNSSSVAPEP